MGLRQTVRRRGFGPLPAGKVRIARPPESSNTVSCKWINGLGFGSGGHAGGRARGQCDCAVVDLAQHVERWDVHRFWLGERAISGLACSATAVLIGHVAGATGTIRVGSGGVMLPNPAPLVVAEQFGTLEAMYPGRIDLGLGRAPGSDSHTMRALRRDFRQTGEDFPDLLEELQGYLGPEKPGQVVRAIPGQGSNVPITLLGSSGFSAQLAGDARVCRLRSRRTLLPSICMSRCNSIATNFVSEVLQQATSDGGGAGDCGGDGCGGPAVIHHTTATFSPT